MMALSASAERLRAKRGVSRRKLALLAGVEVTHMSHFLNGKKGLSVEKLWRVAQALGGVLAVDEGDEALRVVGTVGAQGELHTEVSVSFPAMFEVAEGFGPFRVGDRVMIHPAEKWELGKYVVVDTASRLRLCQAVEHDGVRGLLTSDGDVLLYQPTRQRIVGRAVERIPAAEAL